MEVSFKANLKAKTQVLKLGKYSGKYSPCDVNIVQLAKYSNADMQVLRKLVKVWPFTFAINIYEKALSNRYPVDIYAITSQESDFERLETKHILGLAETSLNDKDSLYLEFLQTNPEYICEEGNNKPLYKHVGTELVNVLKRITKAQAIKTSPHDSSITFFESNEFKLDPQEKDSVLIWEKK